MTRPPRRFPNRDEAGVFLVLYALMIVALFTMVAIVVDIGAVRTERRKSRNAADAAALAGALDLGSGRQQACRTAVIYAFRNLGLTPPASPCSTFPTTACTSTTGPTDWPETSGDFTIVVRQPVPDNDALMSADTPGGDRPQSDPTADGGPCDRIAVEIEYTREAIFSKVIGAASNKTTVHSVALAGQGSLGEPAALLILDQTGCEALKTSGQGSVVVEDTVSSTGEEKPGIIAMESDGSQLLNPIPGCNNANSYTIDANNNSLNKIVAEPTPSGDPGRILSYALATPTAAKSYDPADVASTPARLTPTPTLTSKRITRAPVDHRYNCKTSNGCADPPNPYIDQLVASLGGPAATPPTGYRIYPDELVTPPPLSGETPQPAAACNMPASAAAITVPSGNWFVNCQDSGPNPGLRVANVLTFLGGNVVTRGGVSVGGFGSSITFNAAGATSTSNGIVYIRSGNFVKDGQGSLFLRSVTVYLTTGRIDLGAGSGSLDWVAPASGNLDDLALWSESTADQRLGGQSGLNLEGVLFTPNAQFIFNGQPGVNQTKAQFIAKRLLVAGLGELRMRPDPDRVVLLPLAGTRLIR